MEKKTLKLDFLYLTELYGQSRLSKYGQHSGMNRLEMQCLEVCVFFVCVLFYFFFLFFFFGGGGGGDLF